MVGRPVGFDPEPLSIWVELIRHTHLERPVVFWLDTPRPAVGAIISLKRHRKRSRLTYT